MNIALDVDGTIDKAPEFFSAFSKAMRKDGHKIYIFTSRMPILESETIQQLEEWDIEYDELVLTYEKRKIAYARPRDIDYAFDDTTSEYNERFSIGGFRLIKVKKDE